MDNKNNERYFKLEKSDTPALLQIFNILNKISANTNKKIYSEPQFVFRGITK